MTKKDILQQIDEVLVEQQMAKLDRVLEGACPSTLCNDLHCGWCVEGLTVVRVWTENSLSRNLISVSWSGYESGLRMLLPFAQMNVGTNEDAGGACSFANCMNFPDLYPEWIYRKHREPLPHLVDNDGEERLEYE